MKLNRKNIWNERQNKPTLIVEDLVVFGVDKNKAYEILLRRGAFKWFAVREEIILLKNEMKRELAAIQAERVERTGNDRELRGRLLAITKYRNKIRALCHSQRWQCPRRDKKAQHWLQEYESDDFLEQENGGKQEC